jgi:hypothetical protein
MTEFVYVYGQIGEVVGFGMDGRVWDGSRYTALSEALFVALFAVGDGLLGSNPVPNPNSIRRYNVNPHP